MILPNSSSTHRVKGTQPFIELCWKFWAQSKLAGTAAYERNGNVLRYMNTENVARDMLAITEAYGREKLQYYGVS